VKVKVKVKLALERATKVQSGNRGVLLVFSLTSTLEVIGGQSHAPAASPPGKRPGTHFIGGWLGPSVGLDGCGKSRPHQGSIPGPSSP
jgi:hypothetical protein